MLSSPEAWLILGMVVVQVAVHIAVFGKATWQSMVAWWRYRPTVVDQEKLQLHESYFQSMRRDNLPKLFRVAAHIIVVIIVAQGLFFVFVDEVLELRRWSYFGYSVAYAILFVWCFAMKLLSSERVVRACRRFQISPAKLFEMHLLIPLVYLVAQGLHKPLPHPYRNTTNLVRLGICAVNMNMWHSVVACLLGSGSWLLLHGNSGSLQGTDIVLEVSACLATGLITYCVEQLARSAAVSAVEARSSRKELKALDAILNATCDATVLLGTDLDIIGPCPKLSALLFGTELREKTPFANLLASDTDKEIFHSAVVQPTLDDCNGKEQTMAQAFHVNLADKLGNKIEMEMFHAHFETLAGEMRYLIGMVECGDAVSKAVLEGQRASGRLAANLQASTKAAAAQQPKQPSSRQSRVDRGTKPTLEMQQLPQRANIDTVEALPAEQASRASSAKWIWTHPGEHLVATPFETKEAMILDTSVCWNFAMPRRTCCYFHAVALEYRHLAQRMGKRGCRRLAVEEEITQCSGCGLVGTESPVECFFCKNAADEHTGGLAGAGSLCLKL